MHMRLEESKQAARAYCAMPPSHACLIHSSGGDINLSVFLSQRVASEFLGISDEEMDWRMAQLLMVVPGLEVRHQNEAESSQ